MVWRIATKDRALERCAQHLSLDTSVATRLLLIWNEVADVDYFGIFIPFLLRPSRGVGGHGLAVSDEFPLNGTHATRPPEDRMLKFIDPDHPFYRPLLIRLLIVGFCGVWTVVEFLGEQTMWGMIFLAVTA
jgi:hypothetical protein